MKVYEVTKGSTSLEGLSRAERPDPKPGPNEVLVRMRAVSLNYRDLAVVTGNYFAGPVQRSTIPLSDGAGEVAAVGPGVDRFKIGDHVAPTFFQVWTDGARPANMEALGSPMDGVLAEYLVAHQDGLVALPSSMSFEEGASLPCAGVTAWNAVEGVGKPVKPGDTVLTLGTGGVSIFALQFSRAAGARVIVTSSSDEKLDRARKLGATDAINYKRTPNWPAEVMKLTDGRGADHVIEVGGAGTLAKSFQSLAFGGKVALIGVLSGPQGDTSPHPLMMKGASMHGIFVGSRALFETMKTAIIVNRIKPVVDKIFAFNDALDAYKLLAAGGHFGKVVIKI
jgi:NADPH:quinone reductase-like Zn-dependent oxidoreductase